MPSSSRQALTRDFNRLVEWASQPGCPISGLSLHDDGRLDLTLSYSEDDEERRCSLIAQLNADRYPSSGALLREEGAVGGSMADTLELVNASLSDGAPLGALVETLAATIGIEVDGLEAALAPQPGDVAADGGDDDDDVEDAMNQSEDTDRALLDLQRRWQHRVAREDFDDGVDAGGGPGRGKLAIPAALRGMFSSSESSKILVTELLQLVRDNMVGLTDFRVTAVDDCVHHWRVSIADLDPSSRLRTELRAVEACGGRGGEQGHACRLELELGFTRGLHPTYPPWLRLLSPRLAGQVGQAVMSSSLFTPTGWDPLKPSKAAVRSAQALLEAHGSLAHPAADAPGANGLGEYTRAEHVLCRLEALSCGELRPRWAMGEEGEQLYRAVNAVTDDERQRLRGFRTVGSGANGGKGSASAAKVAWAAGTGYGHGKCRGENWDAKAAEAAQQQLDAEVRTLLDELTHFASKGELPASVVSPSCLLPLLRLHLRGASINDMRSRVPFFGALLRLLAAMAAQPELRPLLYQTAAAAEADAQAEADAANEAAAAAGLLDRTPTDVAIGGSPAVPLRATKRARVAGAGRAAPAAGTAAAAGAGASSSSAPASSPHATTVAMAGSVAAALEDAARTAAVFVRLHSEHVELARASPPSQADKADEGRARALEGARAGAGGPDALLDAAAALAASLVAPAMAPASTVKPRLSSASAAASSADAERVAEEAELLALTQLARSILDGLELLRPFVAPPPPPPSHAQPLRAPAAQAAATPTEPPAAPAAVAASTGRRSASAAAATRASRSSSAQQQAAAAAAHSPPSTAAAAAAPVAPAPSEGGSAGAGVPRNGAAALKEREGALSPEEIAELGAAYEAALRPLLFECGSAFETHRYLKEGAAGSSSSRRAKRIMVEAPDLSASLPLNFSSSVCVRIDSSRMHLWRALITGPDDTPYASGCFVFDLFLPSEYPLVPPKVLLTTTGGGTIRFNPNLYADGKVCLSLLGTWQGDAGESWHAETSTVLQVLMSIQALILVAKPYYNEPGLEMQTDAERVSTQYNQKVREATIKYAMIGHLKAPPSEFADVIRHHFRLKRRQIKQQCVQWIADAGSDLLHRSALSRLSKELEIELDKLG